MTEPTRRISARGEPLMSGASHSREFSSNRIAGAIQNHIRDCPGWERDRAASCK
jgi:hypothetical protein